MLRCVVSLATLLAPSLIRMMNETRLSVNVSDNRMSSDIDF